MIRLSNDNLSRALHASLYQRLRQACLDLSPEFAPEPIVNEWLTRLYNNDLSLHILVTLDDTYAIIEHAVIDIRDIYNQRIVYCHQIVKDKPTKDIVDEYAEYLDKLANAVGAACTSFTVAKNAKVYEKRYGYKTSRIIMYKTTELSSAAAEV